MAFLLSSPSLPLLLLLLLLPSAAFAASGVGTRTEAEGTRRRRNSPWEIKKINIRMFPQNVFLSYQVALGHGRGGDSRLAAAVDYPETNKKNLK